MPKEYKCAVCHLAFEAENPQRLEHPDDLKLVGVSEEEAAQYPIVVCGDCLDEGKEPNEETGETA